MRRATGTAAVLATVLCALTCVSVTAQSPKSVGNAESITQDELKTYLYFLAADQLEGRNVPSRGYDTAALYIASHLKQWGVKPGGSATGTNGPLQPYFMPIELVSNQMDAAGMKLTLTIPAPAGGGRRRAGAAAAAAGSAAALCRPGRARSSSSASGRSAAAGGGGRGGGAAVPAVDIADAKLVFVGPRLRHQQDEHRSLQGHRREGQGARRRRPARRTRGGAGGGGAGGRARRRPAGGRRRRAPQPARRRGHRLHDAAGVRR